MSPPGKSLSRNHALMAYMILRKLEGGELLAVATLDDLEEALRLAEGLYEHWPAVYSVQDLQSGTEIPVNDAAHPANKRLRERPPDTAAPRWRN